MYILAIETTGPHCSAALIDENGNVMEKSSGGTLNHLQNLLPMVKELLDDCKLQIDDVAAVAVSCGPGSFTGIRIGVTTARALCQAVDKPAIAVPTLKSFVYHGNLLLQLALWTLAELRYRFSMREEIRCTAEHM